ncbi:MAG: MATE family efflux transporter [Candidatus Hatepunaea meridiana]|nr:MATE family efflux transporter [Candidatus Hatepunaea meridiana]
MLIRFLRNRGYLSEEKLVFRIIIPKLYTMRIWLKKDLSIEVWKLAGPVVLGMISQMLMNVVDTAMVGRLNAAALAATGLGGMLSWLVLGTLGGLSMGIQAITARRFGEGDKEAAGRVLDNGLLIAFIVGIICTVFFSQGMSRLFQIFSEDPVVVAAGSGYMFYRLLGGLPFMLISAHKGFFNGISKTKLHMRVMILNNVLNVALNYALIFGKFGFPRMEVHGAGLATTLATIAGAVYFLLIALNHNKRKTFKYYRLNNLDFPVCSGIIKLAVPSGLQVLLAMTGYSVFAAIAARIGTVELAATNVCITIWSLTYLPGAGLGVAAASLIGQKLGEGNPAKAEAYGWESARMGIIVMGMIGITFILIPAQIFKIFTNDATVIQTGIIPLRILGMVQVFDATGMVLSQALQGAGMNKWVLKIELLMSWCFFIPCTYLIVIVFGLGLNVAWIVLSVYLTLYGTIITAKFAGGKWKTVKV